MALRSEKMKKKMRVDYHFHQFIKVITDSRKFDIAIMLAIILNTISMTLDTSYYYREQLKYVIFIADEMFLGKLHISLSTLCVYMLLCYNTGALSRGISTLYVYALVFITLEHYVVIVAIEHDIT